MEYEQAKEIISDYPLYASTDGITKELTIKIAKLLVKE